MTKVLLEICVPAIGDFDVFAPVDVSVQKLSEIIATGIAEVTNGNYIVSAHEQLCMKEPLGVLHPAHTLQDYGIQNGTQLYLI